MIRINVGQFEFNIKTFYFPTRLTLQIAFIGLGLWQHDCFP